MFVVPLPTVLGSFSIEEINKKDLPGLLTFPTWTSIPLPQAYTIKLLSQASHYSFCESQVRLLEKNPQEGGHFPYVCGPQHLHTLTSSLLASTNSLTELFSWTLLSVPGCTSLSPCRYFSLLIFQVI